MYCDASDVQAEFKNITFSETTLTKSSEVEAWILQADALIDSFIGKRYAVPVESGDTALALLRLFSATLVADRVRKKLEVVQGATEKAQQNPKGMVFSTKDVLDQLRAIARGDMNLVGVGEISPEAGFSGTDGFGVTPVFKKDTEQW